MTVARILKIDPDRNLVFGWANVSIRKDGQQIEDHQGDLIDPEDLEDAAYSFMLDFSAAGEMHTGQSIGRVIESFVVTKAKLQAMGLSEEALPLGWWFGAYIEDDAAFAKVKAGEYRMFSIQGRALPVEV